jgi:hypothetical protein
VTFFVNDPFSLLSILDVANKGFLKKKKNLNYSIQNPLPSNSLKEAKEKEELIP